MDFEVVLEILTVNRDVFDVRISRPRRPQCAVSVCRGGEDLHSVHSGTGDRDQGTSMAAWGPLSLTRRYSKSKLIVG